MAFGFGGDRLNSWHLGLHHHFAPWVVAFAAHMATSSHYTEQCSKNYSQRSSFYSVVFVTRIACYVVQYIASIFFHIVCVQANNRRSFIQVYCELIRAPYFSIRPPHAGYMRLPGGNQAGVRHIEVLLGKNGWVLLTWRILGTLGFGQGVWASVGGFGEILERRMRRGRDAEGMKCRWMWEGLALVGQRDGARAVTANTRGWI